MWQKYFNVYLDWKCWIVTFSPLSFCSSHPSCTYHRCHRYKKTDLRSQKSQKHLLCAGNYYHGNQWGFKFGSLYVMNITYGLIRVHWLRFWPEKALLMRKQASVTVLARAFRVMNSLVAYTLQQEIQHVCQGYLGKSHSLVCGSVAFYYLPQSFKSNSISSLLPGPASVSAERTLDSRWYSLMDRTAIACRWL